jgi:hypothetical protein
MTTNNGLSCESSEARPYYARVKLLNGKLTDGNTQAALLKPTGSNRPRSIERSSASWQAAPGGNLRDIEGLHGQ